jgi:acyl-coenzyme A thioesterase PaaI-like protein
VTPSGPALNEEQLRPNTCFGCGPDNPEGLGIRIFRDGERTDRLIGTYLPRELAGGFPQIVHGGLQFTALDCMAGWVVFALRSPGAIVPLTKSASMRFVRPARLGSPLKLSAEIVREAPSLREPIAIRAEVCDDAGFVLSEAEIEYVRLPEERFMKAVGISVMPDGYQRHFASHR